MNEIISIGVIIMLLFFAIKNYKENKKYEISDSGELSSNAKDKHQLLGEKTLFWERPSLLKSIFGLGINTKISETEKILNESKERNNAIKALSNLGIYKGNFQKINTLGVVSALIYGMIGLSVLRDADFGVL